MNFFRTVSIFRRNAFVNPYRATLRHVFWQFRKGTNRFPCVLSVQGLSVEVRDRDIANGCGALLNAMGYYDPNNMFLLQELVENGLVQVFFDVGANIGVYSLIAGRCSSVQVHSFEPHPYTYQLLCANVHRNHLDNVSPQRLALSDRNGFIAFTDRPGSPLNRVIDKENDSMPQIVVPVATGDVFCHRHGIVPDLLKIDVEGHEISVLKGFVKNVQHVRMIFLEDKQLNTSTYDMLQHSGYSGPYKVDYQKRRLSTQFDSYEDWVYLRPEMINTLREIDFRLSV